MKSIFTVQRLLDAVDSEAILKDIAQLCLFDRYQASDGINAAVDWLGEACRAIGATVRIERRCLSQSKEWVGFEAPVSWTPGPVSIEVAGVCHLDLERDPFLAAVHSAPLAPSTLALEEWTGGLADPSRIYLIPAESFATAAFDAAGGRVFVTDAGAKPVNGGEFAGRVELPGNTKLTGYCVSTPVLRRLVSASTQGGKATVRFDVHDTAPMPVLEATLKGEGEGELWAMAHICHLRPGANDNASGVAGLLGLLRVLQKLPGRKPTVKLVIGPEFTGISSVLARTDRLPKAVLNFDMIGQGAGEYTHFRLERDPGSEGVELVAHAEHWLDRVFAHAELEWSPLPFHGYSDNSVFTAGPCRVPTVQFCHDFDPLNHSAGDAIGNICLTKISAVVATAAGLIFAWEDKLDADLVNSWVDREKQAVIARAAYWRASGARRWADAFEAARALELLDGDAAAGACRIIVDGPFNLRGLIGRLDKDVAARIRSRTVEDKGFYAALGNAILHYDRGLEALPSIERASFVLGRPIEASDTELILSALCGLSDNPEVIAK